MIGAAQATAIIVSHNELAFTIVDTSGNTLHFDGFSYERSAEAAGSEYFDANWVRCRITINVNAILKQSVGAALLTGEIKDLSNALRAALSAPGAQTTFEPTEPYIRLQIARSDRSINITARLDLAPAIGPVIEFTFECRPQEIEVVLAAIDRVHEAFPERRVVQSSD
jgi:hypothetical protein